MILSIQKEVRAWVLQNQQRLGITTPPDSLVQFAVLSEEVGEVGRCMAKKAIGKRPETRGNLEDELGDVFIALCSLAAAEGINLQEVIEARWDTISQRDWSKEK